MANDGLEYNTSLLANASGGGGAFDASCFAMSSDDGRVMTSIRVFQTASHARTV